jgi:hypothetical protein
MSGTMEVAILKAMRGIDAGAELWQRSTAELWDIAHTAHARVKRRMSKEELITAIVAVTHPAPAPAVELVKVEQARLF